jgi:hypothetical protein
MTTTSTPLTARVLAETIRRALDAITLEDLDGAGIDTGDEEMVVSAVIHTVASHHIIKVAIPGMARFKIQIEQVETTPLTRR